MIIWKFKYKSRQGHGPGSWRALASPENLFQSIPHISPSDPLVKVAYTKRRENKNKVYIVHSLHMQGVKTQLPAFDTQHFDKHF